MKSIATYIDPEGNKTISRLGSYLAWKHQNVVETAPRDEAGTCQICGGFGVANRAKQKDSIRCMCTMETEAARLSWQLRDYRSMFMPTSLDGFGLWGTPESRKTLIEFSRRMGKWADWPDYWLTIIGTTGSGKTMFMSAIATHFSTWSLYLTITDFESHLSRIMSEDNEDESITSFIDAIKYVPILLLDDLGSEYQKAGKDWVKSNLRKIIDFRYLMPHEYPTVITTNLSKRDLMEYDPRIGSRIVDQGLVDVIVLDGVGDYRRQRE